MLAYYHVVGVVVVHVKRWPSVAQVATSLSSSTDVEEVQVVSLLDRLRDPQTSDLARLMLQYNGR